MWNRFAATLEQLHQQYEKIRALQEKKRGILVALDMAALEKLTAEEDFLAKAVQTLEKQRLTQLAQIAQETPGVTPETTMEELLRCSRRPMRLIGPSLGRAESSVSLSRRCRNAARKMPSSWRGCSLR